MRWKINLHPAQRETPGIHRPASHKGLNIRHLSISNANHQRPTAISGNRHSGRALRRTARFSPKWDTPEMTCYVLDEHIASMRP